MADRITADDSSSDAGDSVIEAPLRRRDERGTMAKRHSEYDDFTKASGLYTDSKSLEEAFNRIEDIEDPSQLPSSVAQGRASKEKDAKQQAQALAKRK